MTFDWDGTLDHDHDHKHQPIFCKDCRISLWEERQGIIKIWISISFFATGIFGMDFDVVLIRGGKGVKQTKCRRYHVRHMQRTNKEETIKWSKSEFGRTLLK